MTITGKGGKDRRIPILPAAREAVTEYVQLYLMICLLATRCFAVCAAVR